jgi:uncharacterized protein YcgI (DUF1989 family)
MPIIAPKSAQAYRLASGEQITIVDVEGAQVADVVAFNQTDPAERLSQALTRVNLWKSRPRQGDSLYSMRNRPILSIIRDTVGVHDLSFAPCNRLIYRDHFGVGDREGCLENLARALQPHGIGPELITDPLNVFMHTSVQPDDTLVIHRPVSRPGDSITLRAEIDCIIGISACAEDISDCNAGICTPIGVEI